MQEKGHCPHQPGRDEEALKSLEEALAVDPGDTGAWASKGTALANLGRYEEALQALDGALALDRKDPMTLTNKGTVFINLGRYEEALPPLEEAISIDPGTRWPGAEKAPPSSTWAEEKTRSSSPAAGRGTGGGLYGVSLVHYAEQDWTHRTITHCNRRGEACHPLLRNLWWVTLLSTHPTWMS